MSILLHHLKNTTKDTQLALQLTTNMNTVNKKSKT